MFCLHGVLGKFELVQTPVSRVLAGEVLYDDAEVLIHMSFSGAQERFFNGDACPRFMSCLDVPGPVFVDGYLVSFENACSFKQCVGEFVDVAGVLDWSPNGLKRKFPEGFLKLAILADKRITMRLVRRGRFGSMFRRALHYVVYTRPNATAWISQYHLPVLLSIAGVDRQANFEIGFDPNVEAITLPGWYNRVYPSPSFTVRDGTRLFVVCGTQVSLAIFIDGTVYRPPISVASGEGLCLVTNIHIDPNSSMIVMGRAFFELHAHVEFNAHANALRFFSSRPFRWFGEMPLAAPPVQVPVYTLPVFECSVEGDLRVSFVADPSGSLVLSGVPFRDSSIVFNSKNRALSAHRVEGIYMDPSLVESNRNRIIAEYKKHDNSDRPCYCVEITNDHAGKLQLTNTRKLAMGVEDDKECPICIQPIGPKENLITHLHCGHSLHTICANQWFSVKKTCPMCRENAEVREYLPMCVKGRMTFGRRDF